MKNKKIAIVCNSKNPDLSQYFKCKIEALNQSDLKNSYIALKNKAININDKNIYNSSYTDSAFFDKKVPIDFIRSFYLAFILIFKKVKVVHFTTAHISNLFLSILLKPFKIKQVFTIHDLIPHPGKKAMFINLYNSFVINFLADEIISFSQSEISKQQKKEKFVHMTLSGFTQFIKEPKVGEKTILFFGRIEAYKGLNNLLDLIKKANDINLDYKFIIAGKGKIENIDEFKKFNNVEIINRFIDESEVLELFNKASFTVLPYDSATQSGVIILSYAYATPVIAYNVGSLSEYIIDGETGLLCPYRHNKNIINFLKGITENDIYKMSKNSIEIFKEKYSNVACYKQYLQYFSNII